MRRISSRIREHSGVSWECCFVVGVATDAGIAASDLSSEEAKDLVLHCTILLFKDGEHLLTQGERGHYLFILLEGTAKIVVNNGSTVRGWPDLRSALGTP